MFTYYYRYVLWIICRRSLLS